MNKFLMETCAKNRPSKLAPIAAVMQFCSADRDRCFYKAL